MTKYQGLFITATDTGAGKTTIARWLIPTLEANQIDLCIRKPVESGCPISNQQRYPQDGDLLSQASQTRPPLSEVCPYRFQAATSPAHAARLESYSLSLNQLVDVCACSEKEFLVVEGAGGFYSPLTTDGKLNADLAQALDLPLLLVVGNRLGCVNHTLLTLEAATNRHLKTLAIVINQVNPKQADEDMDNYAEIKSLVGATVPVLQTQFDWQGLSNQAAIKTLAALID